LVLLKLVRNTPGMLNIEIDKWKYNYNHRYIGTIMGERFKSLIKGYQDNILKIKKKWSSLKKNKNIIEVRDEKINIILIRHFYIYIIKRSLLLLNSLYPYYFWFYLNLLWVKYKWKSNFGLFKKIRIFSNPN
jgi:hypothetical protein